jgi:hypothetical protein
MIYSENAMLSVLLINQVLRGRPSLYLYTPL